jgi:hypothetical protein
MDRPRSAAPHNVMVRFVRAGIKRLVKGRQRLQREHLAPLLWADGDAVGDRRTPELFNRTGFELVVS